MIGDEDEKATCVPADGLDVARKMRAFLLGPVPVRRRGCSLRRPRFRGPPSSSPASNQALSARDAIDADLCPFGPQPGIVVAPVITDEGGGRAGHVLSSFNVGPRASGAGCRSTADSRRERAPDAV